MHIDEQAKMTSFSHPNTVGFKLMVHKESSADTNKDMVPGCNCPNTKERTLCPACAVSLSCLCCPSVSSVLSLCPQRDCS